MLSMFLRLFLALFPIVLVLFGSEYLWRKDILRGEKIRKLVHIASGCWVAFWPWLLTYDQIAIIAIIAIAAQVVDRRLKIFHATFETKRFSLGDFSFPAGVLVTALIAGNQWIFAIAILHIALADGMAAVMGKLYGQSNHYKIFKGNKSVAGSLTFLFISYVLMGVAIMALHVTEPSSVFAILLLPPVLLGVENIAPFGLDNLAIPLIATVLLRLILAV